MYITDPIYLNLLAAIRAAPDDDGPRLVAADRLEELGHEQRAELIRVQVRLAQLPPARPVLYLRNIVFHQGQEESVHPGPPYWIGGSLDPAHVTLSTVTQARAEAWYLQLYEQAPTLRQVIPVDKQPLEYGPHPETGISEPRWSWWDADRYEDEQIHPESALPGVIHQHLQNGRIVVDGRDYPSRDHALADLSTACLVHAHHQYHPLSEEDCL